MKKKIGICYSKEFFGENPLEHTKSKRLVYLRLLDLIAESGFEPYVLTKKTYLGDGVFKGVWKYRDGNFEKINEKVKIDLVYDRTGGIKFPPEQEPALTVVNNVAFKRLCWDKWKTFEILGDDMAKTVWVGAYDNYPNILTEIKTDWIVLKPFNGLKGVGIFIGPKNNIPKFDEAKGKKYIAQEYVDTANGIPGITAGLHDLRVVVINNKVVWCHVRIPPKDSFKANAAQGGTLIEVDYDLVPESIKKVVEKISQGFYEEFDNPIFSLDFGIGKDGRPLLFEINDQIGFPRWEMKNRDVFLRELIMNFKTKLQ